MKKHVRLVDHNIERATGLTVETGRFKGTVCLSIGGTIGRMTVNAAELLNAAQAVMSCWTNSERSASTRQKGTKVADDSEGGNERREKLERPTKSSGRQRQKYSAQPRVQNNQGRALRAIRDPHPGNLSRRPHPYWTAYEDRVLAIVSPEIAAKKLRRSIAEVEARMRQLGL
jgi:hypothetical protein